MSVDTPSDVGIDSLPDLSVEHRHAPQPAAHGSSVINVFNDMGEDVDLDLAGDVDAAATVYDGIYQLWQAFPGDRDTEPYVVAELESDAYEWLPSARHGRDWVLVLTSSRWKAGSGTGDDYRAYYEYHLKLREIDDEGELHKPPLALHVEIMPQYRDLVYQDGNSLECVYGEGTRVVCWTTWAESPEDIERRLLDALEAVVDADRDGLLEARNEESRRIAKLEAHTRFDIGWKRQVVEVVDQSKDLIAFGGMSEIEAHQTRQKEGWLEAVVTTDRWYLLGFPEEPYDIELKVYQAPGWVQISRDEPAHHPKLEASFSGVNGGALPHVDEWDDTLQTLREIVSAHLDWAGVGREQLVEDDFFAGPNAPEYKYAHPRGRREQLRERYEAISTELYREALKVQTKAVYDILRTLTIENGSTYDVLEERTGLARSTIRYHVRRLQENGVVERIGNPVLVVFPSLQVLDDAEEVLREVYPDDELAEMVDRAEERREDRENDDPRESEESESDVDQDDDQEESDERSTWRYFEDIEISPGQLATALEREYIEHDHVRLRTDPYDWVG